MTREEMIEWLKLHKHIETRGTRDFESDYAQGCIDGYEYSQMNIESRVCENCKHGIKQNGYESSYMCTKLSTKESGSLFFDMPFGCTEFEVESK